MPIRHAKKQPGKKKQVKRKTQSRIAVSHTRKPETLSVNEWQAILRRQIAEKSNFYIENIGEGVVYSDYKVRNTATKNTYKVALRSSDNSLNYCSCKDFKTNCLGTCKHIEAVFLKVIKKPALRRALKLPYETSYSSMYMEYRGERKIMFRIGTDNAEKYKRLFKPFLNPDKSLNGKGFKVIDSLLKKAFRIDASFRCYEDALGYIIEQRDRVAREELLQPYKASNKLPPLKTYKAKPFPYQKEGILFCAAAGRSILADDMGLGKTIQAIGVAQLMHEYLQVRKVLIICPTSLKYQWQSEIEKFSTSVSMVIEGNYLNRKQLYNREEPLYKIVSYNMAVNDIDLINQLQPDLIILDEAQRIKNWQTKLSQGIKKLTSKFALVLTGTPLENKLQELYSLVQFINPLLLGSLYNFVSRYEQTDATGRVTGYKDLDDIKNRIKTILLRRTRKQVLQQLPERIDKNLFIEITDEQKMLHNDYYQVVTKLVNRWKKTGFLSEEDRQRLLIHLNLMRMVCNSSYVVDQESNYQTKLDELLHLLDELLQTGDEKIVIFSQWERFTRLIAVELDRLEIGYAHLNGKIPSHQRKDLFDRFNKESKCRIFLSTDAGGTGLNLQAGSYLFNMDLPWNPAILEQRIARIYRYGQKKNVTIVNFIAKNTIEHSMLGKLKFKKALSEGILDNGDPAIFMEEGKFNGFMKTVEDLVTDENSVITISPDTETIEDAVEQMVAEATLIAKENFDDDDVKTSTDTIKAADSDAEKQGTDLIRTASSFISQLAQVLSDSAATEKLVQSLTKKDEATGQTYLHIPVKDGEVVKNAVTLLTGLLRGMKV